MSVTSARHLKLSNIALTLRQAEQLTPKLKELNENLMSVEKELIQYERE